MVMGVDQTGQDNMTRQIQNRIGRFRQVGRWPNLFNNIVTDEQPTPYNLSPFVIHRHQNGRVLN
jgi:hypothetical protein